MYEQVDGGDGGVAVSDPTYMKVGAGGGGGGGNTFQLKENEAYAVHIQNNVVLINQVTKLVLYLLRQQRFVINFIYVYS